MTMGRRYRRIARTPIDGGAVRTAPCPNPARKSDNTRAYLQHGAVLFRGCLTCAHTWDHAASGQWCPVLPQAVSR